VISKLDVKLRTPTPPLLDEEPWESKTPSDILEIGSQLTLVKERIQKHLDSLATSMVDAFEKLAKGAAVVAHKLALAQKEIAELQTANKAATQRKSHKRKRIQKEGTLKVEEGLHLVALKEFRARSDGKGASKKVRTEEAGPSQRHCGCCGNAGHNAQNCKKSL
jgi:hypothetical protein